MEFDESQLENTGWRLFISFFKEFYSHEFPEFYKKYKDEIIEYVLLNNKDIFKEEDVLAENLCHQCGTCCRELQCNYLDQETNLCTIHDNPESKVCSIYPWDSDVGFILNLNCGYQKDYCFRFLNNYFNMAKQLKEEQYEE